METGVMQVRLLGPVDVVVAGEPRPVQGLRRKAVLAALALHCGEVVSTSTLADVVWGQRAPSTAVNTLQSHVSYLRQLLGSKDAIRARPPGYLLDLGDEGTDVQAAERLLLAGRQAADPVLGARQLQAALALWRGRPLADLPGLAWLEEQAERLELLGVQVKRALFEARLTAGEHQALVPDLEQMVAGRPLDEQLQAQLMLALYRSGRQADALAAYRRLQQALSEELGVHPGQQLRELEAAILRQDPALDPPAAVAALRLGPPPVPVPAQLPAAVAAFAGRGTELASLDALLPRAEPVSGGPAAVVISALSGTAGVGKTALAVHWAHQVSARFPDGQLYVNLQGFHPGGAAVEPGEAVRGFLEAFGVPVARIPAELPAQAGLYRSVLAGKRVLVVLDNARDVEQVRPLLPGSPRCLAIVTSRNHLTGLVAAEGAYPLTLGLLPAADARDLLARRLGAARVAAEPDAADEIIACCARLPLALTIAAARAASSPGFPLAAVAAELRESAGALDPFHGGDPATDVRAVFSWSYQALSTGAARMFRLLGLHRGPDISVAAAASLAAVEPGRARGPLAELSRAHLLAELAPGRFAFHDLLRAYATEQAHALDSRQDQDAAVCRVLDYYLHTAHAAARLIEPHLEPLSLVPPRPGVVAASLAAEAGAMAWFTAEHAALVAAVRLAADAGFGTRAWQLAWTLSTFLLRCGSWNDNTLAQQAGLDAARRAGDVAGEAHAVHGLALGYARSGRFGDAYPQCERALGLFELIGDELGQARVHNSLTWLAEHEHRVPDALGHAMRALELYRKAGHQAGQAMVLNDIGFCHAQLGSYRQAISYCELGLAAVREAGERSWEAATWDSLGYIHHRLGDHDRSFGCYQRAIDLYLELADRFNEADTLDHLGDAQQAAGDAAAARRSWARALRIFEEISHPDSDRVRPKLGGLGLPPDLSAEVAPSL
ncbi:MAG TPA: BTAD domain-containing putative transcriptional regulator [Streptosporangiaceae bacterium]